MHCITVHAIYAFTAYDDTHGKKHGHIVHAQNKLISESGHKSGHSVPITDNDNVMKDFGNKTNTIEYNHGYSVPTFL